MAKKRKKESDAAAPGGDFMLQFTALMLILLAFFILLNTMAVVDEQKSRTAIGSLHHSFTSPYDGFLNQALESLRAIRSDANGDQVLIEDLIEDLEGSARKQGLGLPGDIKAVRGGFYPRLTVANHVFYHNGGTEIAPRAFPILDRISQAARDLNSRIIIESRTSSTLLDDPRHRSHWELSAERAANLQRYFIDASGLPPDRVEAEGVADTRDEPGKARDLVIITLRPMRPGKPPVFAEEPIAPPPLDGQEKIEDPALLQDAPEGEEASPEGEGEAPAEGEEAAPAPDAAAPAAPAPAATAPAPTPGGGAGAAPAQATPGAAGEQP